MDTHRLRYHVHPFQNARNCLRIWFRHRRSCRVGLKAQLGCESVPAGMETNDRQLEGYLLCQFKGVLETERRSRSWDYRAQKQGLVLKSNFIGTPRLDTDALGFVADSC